MQNKLTKTKKTKREFSNVFTEICGIVFMKEIYQSFLILQLLNQFSSTYVPESPKVVSSC